MAAVAVTATAAVFLTLIVIRFVRQRKWGKCRSKRKMDNSVVIVTGANCGIGKATAEELAKRGACVIMACRDMEKAKAAIDDIRKRTKNGTLKILELDLASFQSIRKFADNFLNMEDRLDVLINNAGVFRCPFSLTKDGYEMQFGVNHLGHFLLTKLLMDKIKTTKKSRIVNVSSMLYRSGRLNLETINSEESYDKRKAYSDSKLANILFSRELSRRLKNYDVTVCALSPGMVMTNLGRHMHLPWWKIAIFSPFLFLFLRTTNQGCQTVLHCAISEEVEEWKCIYYNNCAPETLLPLAEDDVAAKELWEYSENAVAKK